VFIKVSRRVGAVAVYSPLRATLLVLSVLLVVAAAAFFGGRASKSDASDSSPQQAQAPAPAPEPTTTQDDGAADAPAVDTKKVARRSYKRGYRAGAEAAAPGGSDFFKPGQTYLLKIEPGRNGARYSIGPHVQVDPRYRYRICRGGTKICVVPVVATSSESAVTNAASSTGSP
jgi:hypothetical protein